MLNFEYNENEAKEAGKLASAPIPNGVYKLSCIKCEQYTTKGSAKTPSHDALKAEFVVTDGEYEGRHLFVNYVKASGDKRADLMAWYKMTGLKTTITEAGDFIGTEIVAPIVIEKQKSHTDPGTGKVYPERLVNRVVFTIDDPAKIAKSAAVPTLSEPSKQVANNPVDNSQAW